MDGRGLRARTAAVMLAAALLPGAGCGTRQDGKDVTAMPTRDIQTVQEAHIPALMALDGVTGVAIGALDDGTPCIVIYVNQLTDELRAKLPTSLEGHPVRVEATGEFRPLGR